MRSLIRKLRRGGPPVMIIRRSAWCSLTSKMQQMDDRLFKLLTLVERMSLNTDKINAVVASISTDVANLTNKYTNAAAAQIADALQRGRDAQSSEDQSTLDEVFGKLDQLRQQLEANQPITPPAQPGEPTPEPVPSPAQNATGTDVGGGAGGTGGGPAPEPSV
jgi:hypothetical protein